VPKNKLFNVKKKPPYNYIWVKENPVSYITEGFQKFLANLEYVNVDQKYKVLQVTSSLTGEGKSTFFSNVAYLLSEKGHKVILVDLDLRKPKIHRIYDIENKNGITDILTERSTLENSIKKK
jgi:protein-tyrosine kinase